MKCFSCGEINNLYSFSIKKGRKGKEETYYICEECADKKNIELNAKVLPGTADTFIFQLLDPWLDEIEIAEKLICSNCDTSLHEIEATGEVGCSWCYSSFKERIKKLIHFNKLGYLGKTPSNLSFKDKGEYKNKLLEQLKILLEEEEYEDAAKIRDRLKIINLYEEDE